MNAVTPAWTILSEAGVSRNSGMNGVDGRWESSTLDHPCITDQTTGSRRLPWLRVIIPAGAPST